MKHFMSNCMFSIGSDFTGGDCTLLQNHTRHTLHSALQPVQIAHCRQLQGLVSRQANSNAFGACKSVDRHVLSHRADSASQRFLVPDGDWILAIRHVLELDTNPLCNGSVDVVTWDLRAAKITTRASVAHRWHRSYNRRSKAYAEEMCMYLNPRTLHAVAGQYWKSIGLCSEVVHMAQVSLCWPEVQAYRRAARASKVYPVQVGQPTEAGCPQAHAAQESSI